MKIYSCINTQTLFVWSAGTAAFLCPGHCPGITDVREEMNRLTASWARTVEGDHDGVTGRGGREQLGGRLSRGKGAQSGPTCQAPSTWALTPERASSCPQAPAAQSRAASRRVWGMSNQQETMMVDVGWASRHRAQNRGFMTEKWATRPRRQEVGGWAVMALS